MRLTVIGLGLAGAIFMTAVCAQNVGSAGFGEIARGTIEELHPGNVAFVLLEDGAVVDEHYASLGQPVDQDTLFQVGSLSKWIAAWGVMALVEDGRVDLDAPVSMYLTRWSLPESAFDTNGVTVRRLLSHTAGLTDRYGYAGFENPADVQTLEESLTVTADGWDQTALADGFEPGVRVGLEPGAQWRYSGGGFTILQLLIEEVSGRSFNDYLRARILEPLGMSSSTYVLDADGEARLASFYNTDGSIAPHFRFTALAAASLYTSAADLVVFLQAHVPGPNGEPRGRGVLEPETLTQMLEPQTTVTPEIDWGLGLMINHSQSSVASIGHPGSNRNAITTIALVDPEAGDGIIVLQTGAPPLTDRLAAEWVMWRAGSGE
jgi:CubicO group peptidase (beta-lactamase class C family)